MSRAFVKEDDREARIVVAPPELPPGVPNRITPAGARRLRERAAAWIAERAALRKDEAPEARTRVDTLTAELAVWEARAATWVETPVPEAPERMVFGCTAHLVAEDGRTRAITVVGVDEADPAAGRVSFLAPIATAVLGAEPGDTVRLRTPRGEEEWTVEDVRGGG